MTYFVGQAFGIPLSLLEAATVQLLVGLLTGVPMSIGGLGLTQAGDVYVLGIFGSDAASALGISLVRQGIQYGYCGIGGILFLLWRERQELPTRTRDP